MSTLPSIRLSAEMIHPVSSDALRVEGFANPDAMAQTLGQKDAQPVYAKMSLTISLTTILLYILLALLAGALLCTVLLPTIVAFVKHVAKFFKNG